MPVVEEVAQSAEHDDELVLDDDSASLALVEQVGLARTLDEAVGARSKNFDEVVEGDHDRLVRLGAIHTHSGLVARRDQPPRRMPRCSAAGSAVVWRGGACR